MKKLNNRGITTVEVLLCFILVVIIATSMYGTISSFNNKRLIEQYKGKIFSYKELLTKEIQDDFIQIGLTHASYKKEVLGSPSGGLQKGTTIHTVECILQDGTTRKLVIYQALARAATRMETNMAENDYFMIKYGPDDANLIEYPLPDLGESKAFPLGGAGSSDKKIKDFIINNISIKIEEDRVLSIYIGFYHPELGTRYAINITSPISYVSGGANAKEMTPLFS